MDEAPRSDLVEQRSDEHPTRAAVGGVLDDGGRRQQRVPTERTSECAGFDVVAHPSRVLTDAVETSVLLIRDSRLRD
jgi:hypothetical protein